MWDRTILLWNNALMSPTSQGKTTYKRSLQKRIGNAGFGEMCGITWEDICTS